MNAASKRAWAARVFLAVGVAVLGGCGGNPIIGSWQYDFRSSLGILQPFVASASATATFNGDQSASGVVVVVAVPTAPVTPGCTSTIRITGMTWSSTTSGGSNMLAIAGTPVGTTERTGCMNPSDNIATMPETNRAYLDAFVGSGFYTIMGNTMTYTRNLPTQATITLTRL